MGGAIFSRLYERANESFGRHGIAWALLFWFVAPGAISTLMAALASRLDWFWASLGWFGVIAVFIVTWMAVGVALLSWQPIIGRWRRRGHQAPPKTSQSEEKSPWKNTLEDLYNKAFPVLNLERQGSFQVRQELNGLDKEVKFRFRLHQDFVSHVDYVSIFVPMFDDSRLMDMTYEIMAGLRDFTLETREDMRASVGVSMGAPGQTHVSGKDLGFSGRVYIFTQNAIDPIQIGELTKAYREKGMFLEIRGHDYWFFHKDD